MEIGMEMPYATEEALRARIERAVKKYREQGKPLRITLHERDAKRASQIVKAEHPDCQITFAYWKSELVMD